MTGGIRAIEAEPEALDGGFLEADENFARQEGRGGGGDGDADAEPVRFGDQFEQVGSGERVASGENQLRKRVAECGDLAQELNALVESELQRDRRPARLRRGSDGRRGRRLG